MFHHESWKPIYFGTERSKIKVTMHKKSSDMGLCTLASAAFFWFRHCGAWVNISTSADTHVTGYLRTSPHSRLDQWLYYGARSFDTCVGPCVLLIAGQTSWSRVHHRYLVGGAPAGWCNSCYCAAPQSYAQLRLYKSYGCALGLETRQRFVSVSAMCASYPRR